jgi:hypothetical protein
MIHCHATGASTRRTPEPQGRKPMPRSLAAAGLLFGLAMLAAGRARADCQPSEFCLDGECRPVIACGPVESSSNGSAGLAGKAPATKSAAAAQPARPGQHKSLLPVPDASPAAKPAARNEPAPGVTPVSLPPNSLPPGGSPAPAEPAAQPVAAPPPPAARTRAEELRKELQSMGRRHR